MNDNSYHSQSFIQPDFPLMQAALPASPVAPTLLLQPGLAPAPTDAAALDSARLLQGHKAVTIVHNGAQYRLQATRLGKLILTK